MYDLAQAELRGLYGKLADREDILTLRAEIALVRVAIQRVADSLGTNFDEKVGLLNTLLNTAKALVSECARVERIVGMSLDRATLHKFAGEIIRICSEEVKDGDVLERIAGKIIEAFSGLNNESDDSA